MDEIKHRTVTGMCFTTRHDYGLLQYPDDPTSGMTVEDQEFLYTKMSQLYDHHIAPLVNALTEIRSVTDDEEVRGMTEVIGRMDMVKVLVETVSMVRMRYVVEVPGDHIDYALDTVVCNEATEFSQHFLDETIVSHRVIDDSEFFELFDQDNDYLAGWTDGQKLNYLTRIKE